MIFDTDIFSWAQRGNEKAAKLMEKTDQRFLSVQTYMELLQGAKNKAHHEYVKDFLSSFDFNVLPLTENIGHRASIYVEAQGRFTIIEGLIQSLDEPNKEIDQI